MRAFDTEKTEVAEVDRSIYDVKDAPNAAYEVSSGLTPEIVERISEEKHDPEWMRIFRLKSLQTYNQTPIPNWGPSLDGLNMDNIVTYVRPNTEMRGKWSEVPDDIKNTFERLGIPQAERAALAGVGAQYDSEVVYHNVKAEVAAQGVVYTDMESALTGPYAELVRKHFMKLVPPTDHKFAALHGAVWSGGSFVYVPEGVSVEIPLQSYFRLNAPGAGQFEHTLIIVEKGAYLHFIEGCSAPKYNVANLHAGCVEIYVGENARVRYSTIENQAGQGGKGGRHRVGVRLLRLPHLLPLPHEHPLRRGGAHGVHRHHLRRCGAGSGHRRQGRPRRPQHQLPHFDKIHRPGRRHLQLPLLRHGAAGGKGQQVRRLLRVPDAG